MILRERGLPQPLSGGPPPDPGPHLAGGAKIMVAAAWAVVGMAAPTRRSPSPAWRRAEESDPNYPPGVPHPQRREPTIIRTRSRVGAILVALLTLLASAGCGGGDDDGSATTTTSAPAPSSEGAADDTTTTSEAGPADGPAVPSPGCDGGAATEEVEVERRDVPGTTGDEGAPRWYLLTAPADEVPLPLVVDFHGLSEGATVHAQHTMMGELGLDEGFVTAFPNGTGSPVRWQASGADSPELPFVDALLDDIGAVRCIDTSRVYATGLSNGAMMTSLMACFRADRFAAFAPVAGLTSFEDCEPSDPEAILTFHGTVDPILLFNGGVGDLSVITGGDGPDMEVPEADLDGEGYPATAREWAEVLGCDPEPTDEEVTDELLERTWSCPPGSELTFVIVRGGGHTWPGSEFSEQIGNIVGPTTFDIDASQASWEMFQRHQLPGS